MNGETNEAVDLNDPTIPFMALDITTKVLGLVDDLPALGATITEQIRELTGAKLVVLVRCCADSEHHHPALHLNSERPADIVKSGEFEELVLAVHESDGVVFWPNDMDDGDIPRPLRQLGFENGLAAPLTSGATRVGAIIALGLGAKIRMLNLKPTLAVLASAFGLALQNSFLVQERDETIREQTQQLRESEQMAQAILNASTDTVILIDEQGRVLHMNEAYCTAMGRTRDELLNTLVYDDLDPDVAQERLRWHERALATGAPVCFSDEHKGHFFENTICPLPEIHGESRKVVVFARDVTKQRAMESHSAELENHLRQSEKMRVLGQLAGGVAHDFSNLLSAIAGSADLMYVKSGQDEKMKRCYEVIVRAIGRAEDLTKQLTTFAHQGKQKRTRVDIHNTIEQVVGILKHTIDPRITVRQRLKASLSQTVGDATLLYNAFLNLAVNARDAMPEGGELTFETETVALDEAFCSGKPDIEPGQFVRILVSDTGCGIAQDSLANVFEPFFSTKAQDGSRGLGLASVFGTISAHNGWIHTRSGTGNGTTFMLYLPIISDTGFNTESADMGELVTGTGRILVVDDEEDILENVTESLEMMGYEVHTCRDGVEAIEYYRFHYRDIDLVIMDMVMPRMNGRDAFVQMRRINPDAQVMFATGFAEKPSLDDVVRHGAIGILEKPYRTHELSKAIEIALTGSQS